MARSHFTTQIITLLLATVGCFYPLSVNAQEQAFVGETSTPPLIDGKINEDIWYTVEPIKEFKRFIPSEGVAPSGSTEVRFLQDEENLYIGIRVFDTDYQPKARISPRENINDDDQIGIYIDTVGDARTGYIFYFNPLGIQQDIRYSNGNWFMEWNAIYSSKGHVTEDGYEIEISIPFRSLRYPNTEDPNWTLMITRKIPDQGAKYSWPVLKRSHPRMFVQARPLTGISPPPSGAGLSFQPTISGLHSMEREEDSLIHSEVDSWQERIRPSLDLKWGISSDTGITATINPDFSQIEGDVRQLNLNQRFAFYYPERRPFFLDNIDFFREPSGALYTRSIVDPIYGVKLAGREKGVDFGVLQSTDRNPNSSVNEKGTPGFSEEELENTWAINNFVRSRFDIGDQGYLGLVFADKRIVSDPLTETDTPPSAFSDVGGVDINIPFSNVWVASGFSSFSWAGNDSEQLFGNVSRISLRKSPDIGTGGSFNIYNTTADYRKELGFNTQSGNYGTSSSLNHSIAYGESSFWSGSFSGSHAKEYTGNQSSSCNIGQTFNIKGVHTLGMSGGPQYRQYNDVDNLGYYVSLNWRSRLSSRFQYSMNLSNGTEIDYELLVPGSYLNSSLSTTIRPSQRIRIDSSVTHKRYTPQGEETAQGTNTYNRLNWQLTRPWGIRVVQQSTFLSSEDYPSHNGSLLFTWLQSPGTEAYIGAIWNLNDNALQEQTFFAKYTHVFRI